MNSSELLNRITHLERKLAKAENIIYCHDKDIKHILKNCCTGSTSVVTVSAGGDQSVPIGTSIMLSGVASTSAGTISTTTWSLISGPSTVSIASPNSTSTIVNGISNVGTYLFAFNAVDSNGNSATDNVSVSANVSVSITWHWAWVLSDPYTDLINFDNITYQGTATNNVASNIICDFRLANPNYYYIIRVPENASVKSSWYNSPLNSGTIPDSVFRSVLNARGYNYYITRVGVSFDTSAFTTLT